MKYIFIICLVLTLKNVNSNEITGVISKALNVKYDINGKLYDTCDKPLKISESKSPYLSLEVPKIVVKNESYLIDRSQAGMSVIAIVSTQVNFNNKSFYSEWISDLKNFEYLDEPPENTIQFWWNKLYWKLFEQIPLENTTFDVKLEIHYSSVPDIIDIYKDIRVLNRVADTKHRQTITSQSTQDDILISDYSSRLNQHGNDFFQINLVSEMDIICNGYFIVFFSDSPQVYEKYLNDTNNLLLKDRSRLYYKDSPVYDVSYVILKSVVE